MHIVIAGAGRVGGALASSLAEEGHDLVVIDNRLAALDLLGKAFDGLTIHGEAYDVDVLRQAAAERAAVFCAMTDDDNTNLMAAEVAKVVFTVPRVIARLQDPAREESYRALGIPFISTTNLIAAVAFEQIVTEDFSLHVTFTGGDVEIVEFPLGEAAQDKTVATLDIPGELRVAAIRRQDRTYVPDDGFRLAAGDLVVASARQGVQRRLRGFLPGDPA